MPARVLNRDSTSTGTEHACGAIYFLHAFPYFKPACKKTVGISDTMGLAVRPACRLDPAFLLVQEGVSKPESLKMVHFESGLHEVDKGRARV